MKKAILTVLFLVPFILFGQWQNNPNKLDLGTQTTGKGLIYYGNGMPGYTPTNKKNSYFYCDTVTSKLYFWKYSSSVWDTLGAGGGSGLDEQYIDTFIIVSDTIRLSISNDHQKYKVASLKSYLDNTDGQKIDTFAIVSNILRLSISGDTSIFKTVDLSSYLDNTDSQTLSWNSGTGNVSISGGNSVNIDGRYIANEVDGSITNEIQLLSITPGNGTLNLNPTGGSVTLNDSSSTNELQTMSIDPEQGGGVVPVNLSNGNTVYISEGTNINLVRLSSTQLEINATGSGSDNQKIDTSQIVNDTLRLSLQNDAEKYKEISLNDYRQYVDTFTFLMDTLKISLKGDNVAASKIYMPNVANTDNQQIDTFTIVSNVLRVSLQGDNEAFKSVSLSSYLDNTDAQTLSFNSGNGNLTISGGNVVSLDGRYIQSITHDIVTNGNTISQTINGTTDTTLSVRTNTLLMTSKNITSSINAVNSSPLYLGMMLDTASFFNGDVSGVYQNLQIGSSTVGTVEITNGGIFTADLADSLMTEVKLKSNIVGSTALKTNAVTNLKLDVMPTNTIKGNNTGGSANPIDLTTTQVKTMLNIGTGDISGLQEFVNDEVGAGIISGSGITATFNDGLNTITIANTGDLSTSNELQTLSALAGKGTLNLSLGGGSVTLNDSSSTNEIQIIDTARVSGGNLEYSLSSDNVARTQIPVTDIAPLQGVTAGAGIGLSGTYNKTITNTGDTDASNDITTATTAGGDISGTYPNPTVDGIQTIGVSATPPTTGQVLKYNGSVWIPDTDNTGGGSNYYQTLRDEGSAQTQRGKINYLQTTTINPTATDDGANDETEITFDIRTNSIDSSLLKNGSVTLNKIFQEGATSGQFMKWNGSNWRPNTIGTSDVSGFIEAVNDEIGSAVVAGSGIVVVFNDGSNTTTITNSGDLSNTNEIQTLSIRAGKGTIDLTNSTSITLADSSATNELQSYVHSGSSSYTNTLSNSGSYFTLQSSGIATISNSSGTVTIGATEIDGSTSNELQTHTITAGKGTINLSNGGGAVILGDSSSTNELQTLSIQAGKGTINLTNGSFVTLADSLITNEGSLTVAAGTGTNSIINSNTSGSTGVTLESGAGIGITEIGNVITITSTGGYDNEQAQDAVGLMINSSLQYVDATPLLAIGDRDYTDITVSGSGLTWSIDALSIITAKIADNAVTNAKLADVPTSTFKGRTTAGTGDPEDLTIAQAKALLNLSGTNTGDQTITLSGDVTGSGSSSITTTIANDVVTYAKLQNVAANSFLVNPTTSSADVQELVAGNSQLAGRGSTGNIAMITMGAGVQMSGTQLQAVDQTATNELQTVDTFNITTNQLRFSLSQDAPTYTVNLNPYLDNTDNQALSLSVGKGTLGITNGINVILGDSSSTNEIQNITYGAKSGNDIPVLISGGTGVTITQGSNVTIDRNSSTQITVNSTASGTGDVNQNGNSFTTQFRIGSNDNQSVAFEQQDTIYQTIETDGNITFPNKVQNNNNSLVNRLTIKTNSHGTPTTGFGSDILFQAESSTTDDQDQCMLWTNWQNATHATRSGQFGIKLGFSGGALADVFKIDRSLSDGQMILGAANQLYFQTSGIIGSGNMYYASGGSAPLTSYPLYLFASNISSGEAIVLNGGQTAASYNVFGNQNFAHTSGTKIDFKYKSNFSPTSGTGLFYNTSIEGTINQTGGANGITGGININPTLTSISDYRGINIPYSNASAYGLNQSGPLTRNYFAGVNIFDNYNEVKEIAAPGTPNAGYGRVYEKTDNKLYFKNDGGTEYDLTASGGASTNIIVTNGNIITSTVDGIADTTVAIRTVSNTSSANNLSTTVNGVVGSNVNIINSNSNSISGNTFNGSVNGISDTALIIGTNALTFSSTAATLTSTVNGVASSATSLKYGIDSVYYYPETYGAIANDATDDRAAIQAAIDSACNRGGGIIWINKGEFRITTSASRGSYNSGIHLCSNVTLMGMGHNSVIKSTLTTSGQHIISMANSSTNIKILDLQIKSDSLPSGAAVFASLGSDNFTMERVKIDRGACWGVLLKESDKGTITNCDIQNGGPCHGIEINNCREMKITDNYIYSNTTRSYHPSRGNGIESFFNQSGEQHPYSNLISGNTISNTGGGIVIWGDSCTVVSHNIINRISGHGMTVVTEKDAPGETWNFNIKLIGNTINMVGNISNSNLGILCEALNRDISIIGNTIDTVFTANSGSGGGLGIENRADGTIIQDNVILHAYVNGINNSGDYCTINGNKVRDCSVLNSGFRGISNSGDYCTTVGNNVLDTRATKLHDIGIYTPGTNNTISANVSIGNTSGDGIYSPGTGNVETGNKE